MKILVGISGASSINLALKLLSFLNDFDENQGLESFGIITRGAALSFAAENQQNLIWLCEKNFPKVKFFNDDDLAAAPSSGSFKIDKIIIAPCSISTLAKIHAGLANSLLTRAAAVAMKERRVLILGVRELPFSTLNLEHMTRLSQLGVIIAPPVIASYPQAKNLDEMENFIVGKWLELLELPHTLYKKWGEER